MTTINRDFFFHQVRTTLFGGRLRAGQVEGLRVILDYWDANLERKDDRWLAYALATTHHETDQTMKPIHEYGSDEYFRLSYDVTGRKPARAIKMGNTTPGDGVRYCGRGYVQLTWKTNYARAARETGADLVNFPDRAMDPANAVVVLFKGMIGGWFTGLKLADYFNPSTSDWYKARRIINGRDQAENIKNYALQYYAALSYTT